MPKKTLVVGASTNPSRYSNIAVHRLQEANHEVVALGHKAGTIDGLEILTGEPVIAGIHTITMYLNPSRQAPLVDYLLSLKPSRIIFNPGTENSEFMQVAQQKGIAVEMACTLVMISTLSY